MLEQLTTREAVTRIVLAANLGEAPGSFRLQRALAEAERILAELREAEVEAMAAYYSKEMTGE